MHFTPKINNLGEITCLFMKISYVEFSISLLICVENGS